jgi:hypothetical protein
LLLSLVRNSIFSVEKSADSPSDPFKPKIRLNIVKC